jgi:hypothetical protein
MGTSGKKMAARILRHMSSVQAYAEAAKKRYQFGDESAYGHPDKAGLLV